MAPLSSTHVTAHFSRREMGYDLAPASVRPNLEALARLLERVRAAVGGVPLVVTSAYRSMESNAELPGASSSSQHLTGSAADFRPVGINVATFLERLANFPLERSQLIVYPLGSNHVHLGLPIATKPVNTVLVQVSPVAAAPVYQAVALGDSATVYAQIRSARTGAVAVGILVVLALAAFLAANPPTR